METQIEKHEFLVPEVINHTALSLITKAEIDTAIATAHAFPRSIKKSIDKAMSIATISENVAQSCGFVLPRGGKTIEGPSVRLAEIIAASFGNIRSGSRVIDNDGKTITAQGICHDLETNNCITIEVKRKITDKNGRQYNEDMQVMAGNAACAIALRNAIFKVIPRALIDDVYEKTKQVAKGTAETLLVRRKKAVDYFKSLNVKESQICEVLDVKKIEDVDLDKLSVLNGMFQALKNQETTLDQLFPVAQDKEKAIEAAQSKLNDLKK